MPITKSAIKALKVIKKKEAFNKPIRSAFKSAIKTVRLHPDLKNLTKAYSALDKAAKKGIIHRQKANRLKSRLTKLISRTASK